MPTCVPVRDMKNTAAFTALVERERDVTVTRNGYSAMHCLSEEEYRAQRDEVARARLLSRMMRAEIEIAAGSYEDFDAFASEVSKRHDL